MPSAGGRRVYTIPPGVAFVDALAAGLIAEAGGDPLALSRATILLPTRRSVRALQEAFLRRSEGRALLLPRMLPLGDLDADELGLAGDETAAEGGAPALELPPSIAPLRRQLLLAELMRAAPLLTGVDLSETGRPSIDQAARLAAELARFLDQVQTERLSLERLEGLAPQDFAEHWRQTVRFLDLLRQAWPRILAEEGCVDPAERRNLLLLAQAEAWRARPPAERVIAAGSTGSVPATAQLLAVVAGLPRGAVVLPGLDQDADEAAWEAVTGDPAHPQHGMALLLRMLEVARSDVAVWPAARDLPQSPPVRAAVLATALRPAVAMRAWRQEVEAFDAAEARAALAGVTRIDCANPQEESGVVALLLREALETPGKRAALVTPDRALARRVAAELGRWDIAIDDSAGRPLADTPPGAFLRLTAELLAARLAPVALLAVLKHPLAAGGGRPGAFRGMARRLERFALRGIAPGPGFDGLVEALDERAAREGDGERQARVDALKGWLARLAAAATPFAALIEAPLASLDDLLTAHIAFAEWLAASDEASGPARLWAGDAGEAAARFVAELRPSAVGLRPFAGAEYPPLLADLMAGVVVRPRYGRHPRLAIWGPLEARLQQVDRLVLAGLNEGTWPAEPVTDPWLSRPMRANFGLPPPERRIGLAAHDFAQGFGAPEVVLTRALRVEGAPTVPSRWLLRLDGFLGVLGIDITAGAARWRAWQQQLDRPAHAPPITPPAPKPPVAARPRRMRVTAVETWMRDPYAIYAEFILKLRALDPLGEDLGPAERGLFIHQALDLFIKEIGDGWPADPLERLLAAGRQAFGPALQRPTVRAFWWPRFERIARWFVGTEEAQRADILARHPEVRGELVLETSGGPFTIVAKADRVDRLRGGGLAIIDYKTGTPPTKREIELGFAPQLPLEAAMAADGGFPGIDPDAVARLEHWWLSGSDPKVVPIPWPATAAEDAREGLLRLIAAFDDPDTAYASQPAAVYAPRFSDYEHLARVKEWSTQLADEELP